MENNEEKASLQKLNNVKMATAKDLGEYNDLHPQKEALGLRIARPCMNLTAD